MSTDLITGTEAAEILGIDRSTLTRWSDPKLSPEHRRIEPVMSVGRGNKYGPKLYKRADVEALRDQLAAERAEARSA